MPQKRTTKKTTARKTAASTPVRKAAAPTKAPADVPAAEAATEAVDVCPRCGTTKFGPEQRTRVDGNRTVRFTMLVCERGHTFAKPARRTA